MAGCPDSGLIHPVLPFLQGFDEPAAESVVVEEAMEVGSPDAPVGSDGPILDGHFPFQPSQDSKGGRSRWAPFGLSHVNLIPAEDFSISRLQTVQGDGFYLESHLLREQGCSHV